MTKILLVRHGHVEGISPERFRGRADLPLTVDGRRQAEATARRIHATWRPVAVYASPLSRSRETAAAIGRPLGLAPTSVEGLADIDYGQWQGLTPDEVRRRWPAQLDLWHRAPDQTEIPGGETLQQVQARVSTALQTVRHAHPQDTAVMVGHDSVNRVLLLHALGAPLRHYWRIRQSPCAINELDVQEDGFVIVTVNQTDHLLGS
jgi:broad specificity phosphatase PhoE